MKNISILGSTGSIGRNTLDVIEVNKDKFNVVALSCSTSIETLKEQIIEFDPQYVAVKGEEERNRLLETLPMDKKDIEIGVGDKGLKTCATLNDADTVVSAIVGAKGFIPTLEAVKSCKQVALANKESLVIGGKFIMEEAKKNDVLVLPVDSEHSAIFQSLQGSNEEDIKRIVLTASGGPFFGKDIDLETVTPTEALSHPNWDMGKRITIDSATLMNKGLEVIEANWLFGLSFDKIDIVIHPQSIMHSFVEFVNGSIIGELGSPDMRGPISYALSYPRRVPIRKAPFSIFDIKLDFYECNIDTYPCLRLAYAAGKEGNILPVVLNGADEEAVELFLEKKIRFNQIPILIEMAMNDANFKEINIADDVMEIDKWARRFVREKFKEII